MTAQQLATHTSSPKIQFVRDHLIWIYYALVGLGCYIMSALGPVMPFLRSELSMNYRLVGIHFSAFAVGTVLAGMFGDKLVQKLGRVGSLRLSVGATIAGLLCFITGTHPSITIVGILICGFSASMTYQTLATIVSGHLGENRKIAFVEAEVVAMLGGGLAPFAISACVSARLGWRAAFITLILLFAASIPLLGKFGTAKHTKVEQSANNGRLPLAFWSYALIIFLSVSAEWSTAFWSADYLHNTLLISKATAAAAVGAFFVGMVLGRYSGSHLIRKHSSSKLLKLSGLISLVGFLLFWLGHDLTLNISGLFFTGLGIANMYPLCFSEAVGAAPNQTSQAIARVSLMCGVAILLMPLALSFIADRYGLFTAYAMVAVVLIFCLCSILFQPKSAAASPAST